jgi:hypothetical protein
MVGLKMASQPRADYFFISPQLRHLDVSDSYAWDCSFLLSKLITCAESCHRCDTNPSNAGDQPCCQEMTFRQARISKVASTAA